MSNTHRIAWIDAQIRGGAYPNAVTIAEQFSISPRQAARDLEYLRDSMRAPLTYSRERKGYFYEGRPFAVTSLLLSEEERGMLSYLAEQYKRLEDEHATHLAGLFRRLAGEKAEEAPFGAVPVFPVEPATLAKFDTINEAIRSHHKVLIRGLNRRGEPEETMLSPYKQYVYRKESYVVGYCERERGIRLFRLTELREAVPTGELYDLAPLLARAEVTAFLPEEADTAIIRFDTPPLGDWPEVRLEEETPGVYRVSYTDKDKLFAKLFACQTPFDIIFPRWLHNLAVNRLKRLARHL